MEWSIEGQNLWRLLRRSLFAFDRRLVSNVDVRATIFERHHLVVSCRRAGHKQTATLGLATPKAAGLLTSQKRTFRCDECPNAEGASDGSPRTMRYRNKIRGRLCPRKRAALASRPDDVVSWIR